MTRRTLWYSIRGSLWFIPGALVAGSVALALLLVQVDLWLDARNLEGIPDALSAGPEGARQILSVIAGSMMTVAGVIFSITIVTLSLAAAQYSPRVLRSFMRDRLNQAVLGVLVAVFAYNLMVLRAVRSGGDSVFVPQLSVWMGILLVFVAIGFFIAFIHNTAVSIQAPEIVSRIADETLHALATVRETSHDVDSADTDRNGPSQRELKHLKWETVPSRESGYVQDIDLNGLFSLACEQDLIIRAERPVGDFTVAGRPLVYVNAPAPVDDTLIHKIQQQFGINSYRTVDQDPVFGIRQLVDIALKALAPSTNDSSTAVHCVDYLGVILHSVIREPALPQTHSRDGKLRVIVRRPDCSRLVDLALTEIRQSAQGNVAVLLRMFRLVRELREEATDPQLRAHLRKHIGLISENIDRYVPSAEDRGVLERSAGKAIAARPGDGPG